MQQSTLEKPQMPTKETPETKLQTAIENLKTKQIRISEELLNAKGNKAKILEMDLEDILKQIKAHETSLRNIRSCKRKSSNPEILNFKKKKREGGGVILTDEEKEIAKSLITDIENFKRRGREGAEDRV